MEKTELIKNLKSRVGEDNAKVISERTFDGIASVYLPMFADDSAVTEETWKFPIAALNEFAGQKRFDEKEFAEKFKADYAKEYEGQHQKDVETRINAAVAKALEDYKKEHPEQGGGSSKDDIEAKVQDAVKKAMAGLTGVESEFGKSMTAFTEYMKKQAEREKNDVRNRVKSDLRKHLISLKANNEACVDDALDDIEYGDSPTFDALKQSAIDAYEKRYKRYYADGGKPFGGTGEGGGEDKSYVQKRIEELKKTAKESADYAAELEKTFC